MEYLKNFTDHLVQQSWQIAALFLLVAVGSFLLRNKSSHWRYLLWCVILAKCLLPPVMTFNAAVLPNDIVPSNSAVIEDPQQRDLGIENRELNNQKPNYNIQTIPNNQNSKEPRQSIVGANRQHYTAMEYIKKYFHIFVFAVWGVGAIVFLIVAGVRAFLLNRWILRERQLPGEDVSGEIEKLKSMVSSEFLSRIWVVDKITQPFVWGLWRGCAYLPAGSKNSADVIMHELAHIIRLDAFVNLLQIFAQAIFWFHPFVWIANNRIRAEREKSCDEIAIARLKISPRSYSIAVVDVLVREYQARKALPSLAVAGPVKNIEERIRTIMAQGKKFYSRPTAAAVITVLILAAIFVPTTIALTKVEPEKNIATEDTENTEIKQGDFIATLSNGTTVELISICEHPSKGKQWWRPDGSLLEQRPWEKINGSVSDGFGTNTYEFAFKLNHPANNVPGWYITFENSGSMSSGTFDSGTTNLTSWFAVALPSNIKQTSLSAFLAIGKWKERFSREASSGTGVYAEGANKGGVVWLSPVESDGKTSIAVSHSFRDLQTRIIAIDKDNTEHTGSYNSASFGSNSNATMQASFNLPLKEIKEFKLQTRPYEKYVFKNVSLKPNFKTNVQIGTEKLIATETKKTVGQGVAHLIDFEITKQAFLPGDSIEITEILSSSNKIETGQTYTIKGNYKLSSTDEAMLHIYATNGETGSKQGPVVKKGSGDFTRTFTYKKEGWLHLSFYPANGGNGFGVVYFAQKGSGQKAPDISNVTDNVSVENSLNLLMERRDILQKKLQNLVEDFCKHNYRDITARKTIEWGEPTIDANGGSSIRYKYEATIWDKDKIITNQLFVFDKDGKLISFNKIQADIKLPSADKKATFEQSLSRNVTVDIEKSPDGNRLTVQYAVIAVCDAAGVPYKWEKSAKLAEPERLKFIESLHIKDTPARKAITDILKPFGLNYAIDADGLFIYKNQ